MLDETIYHWYSPEWFLPAAFRSFDWELGFLLPLLFVVPAIFLIKWLVGTQIKQKLAEIGRAHV